MRDPYTLLLSALLAAAGLLLLGVAAATPL